MQLPKILQNSAIYTMIMVLQKGISFFLLPVYTMFLSPSDYGILGVTTSLSSFLSIFITLGLSAAAGRFYYTHEKDEEYCKKVYGAVAAVVLTTSLIFGIIFIVAHKYIVDPVAGKICFYPYLLLGLLNTMVTPMYVLYQDYLQARQEGLKYGINAMLCFLMNVSLIVLFLTVFNLGVVGVLLANLTTSITFFIYVFLAFILKLRVRYDRVVLKDCFKYAIPLLPHTLANWSNDTIDKLLVNGIRSEADAGMYNLGQQYGSVMSFVALAMNNAYLPWFYERVNDGESGRIKIRKLAEFATCVLSFIALVMALFSQEVFFFMVPNPEYDGVWRITSYVLFAFVFQGVYFFFVNVLFLNDTKVIFTITITSMGVNVVLNILLIPSFGFLGSAISCLATYFIKSIMALIVSSRRNRVIRFNWIFMYFISIMSFGISTIPLLIEGLSILCSLVLKIFIISLFVGFITLKYSDSLFKLIRNYKEKI